MDHFAGKPEIFIGAIGDEEEGTKSQQVKLGFQVTDVKKPLLAIKKVCEKGNLVQFGPGNKDSFIQSKQTGDKIYLTPKGASYVMDVQFGNGEWTQITVDSAAEESVCPREWAQQYGINQVREDQKMRLINANGGKIEHYGQRDVFVWANSTF